MLRTLSVFFDLIPCIFRSRRSLLLQVLALRQQLAMLERRHPQPRFRAADRLFWVLLRRLWPDWKRSLILVQPETVVRWHRARGQVLLVLDLATQRPHRKKVREQGIARSNLPHDGGEPDLERASHSRRTQDAGRRHLGADGTALDAEGAEEPGAGETLGGIPEQPPRGHRRVDFFTVPTLTFGMIYCFFVISHDRRRILQCNVTRHPTAAWVSQQLREAPRQYGPEVPDLRSCDELQ